MFNTNLIEYSEMVSEYWSFAPDSITGNFSVLDISLDPGISLYSRIWELDIPSVTSEL